MADRRRQPGGQIRGDQVVPHLRMGDAAEAGGLRADQCAGLRLFCGTWQRASPGWPSSASGRPPRTCIIEPAFAGLVGPSYEANARSICDSLTLLYEGLHVTGCWANVSQQGFPHRQHIHPNNYLSGAYYVKTAPGADSINFHDPRPQATMLVPPARNQDLANPDQVSLDVSDGMLVMFPAWLNHSVAPNRSAITRISVAFNLMFPEFGTKMASPLWRGDTGAD